MQEINLKHYLCNVVSQICNNEENKKYQYEKNITIYDGGYLARM